jgi:excisionase family DNA binding protein
MEKICIVKRRQQNTKSKFKGITPDNQSINISTEEPRHDFNLDNKTIDEKNILEEFNNESGHVISITMTSEQSFMLQSSEYIRDLLSGQRKDPSLYLKRSLDGRIIFNFCLYESPTVHMLRFDQVCQMLQVSRSFLQKLVHEKALKSYKLGRLRRFAMEDILDYLINNEEFDRHVDGY